MGNKTPDNDNICYAFNLGGCKHAKPGAKCEKGLACLHESRVPEGVLSARQFGNCGGGRARPTAAVGGCTTGFGATGASRRRAWASPPATSTSVGAAASLACAVRRARGLLRRLMRQSTQRRCAACRGSLRQSSPAKSPRAGTCLRACGPLGKGRESGLHRHAGGLCIQQAHAACPSTGAGPSERGWAGGRLARPARPSRGVNVLDRRPLWHLQPGPRNAS